MKLHLIFPELYRKYVYIFLNMIACNKIVIHILSNKNQFSLMKMYVSIFEGVIHYSIIHCDD